MDMYAIAVQGLEGPDPAGGTFWDWDDQRVQRSAVQAINKTIERSRTSAARRMQMQVAFPGGYFNKPGRLQITKKAQRSDLEAIITGRHRPTSLATFARNGGRGRGVKPRIEVQPGLVKRLDGAFFVNLRTGNTETKNNLGLAIRLKPGQVPNRAYKPQRLSNNLWLLYGPSVDQVFDDVALDMSPESADFLEAEFLRLMGI